MKVEIDKDIVKQLRLYFGENDKSPFEQYMFEIFDEALKQNN